MRLAAVLDTNVLVSALLEPRGLPARLLDHAIEGTFDLVVSDYLLDELSEVLERIDRSTRRDTFQVLRRLGRTVRPLSGTWSVKDAGDNPVVGTAAAAGADYLVTGDRGLLDLASVAGTEIVSVRRFNKILARESGGR